MPIVLEERNFGLLIRPILTPRGKIRSLTSPMITINLHLDQLIWFNTACGSSWFCSCAENVFSGETTGTALAEWNMLITILNRKWGHKKYILTYAGRKYIVYSIQVKNKWNMIKHIIYNSYTNCHYIIL